MTVSFYDKAPPYVVHAMCPVLWQMKSYWEIVAHDPIKLKRVRLPEIPDNPRIPIEINGQN